MAPRLPVGAAEAAPPPQGRPGTRRRALPPPWRAGAGALVAPEQGVCMRVRRVRVQAKRGPGEAGNQGC
eukprot:675446-Lingulodinium_polyedra.AAC.1